MLRCTVGSVRHSVAATGADGSALTPSGATRRPGVPIRQEAGAVWRTPVGPDSSTSRRFVGGRRLAPNGGIMQQTRWERLAPLTGVVAVAIIIAVFAIGESTPDEHDSALKVQACYAKH